MIAVLLLHVTLLALSHRTTTKTSSNSATAPRGASLYTTGKFVSIQNNSGLPQGLAGRSVAACCRQTDCLGPSASGVVISCRAARPIINMRQRDFIALIGGAPARPLATLVQELSTDRQEMP
jgi:hypothetical protein